MFFFSLLQPQSNLFLMTVIIPVQQGALWGLEPSLSPPPSPWWSCRQGALWAGAGACREPEDGAAVWRNEAADRGLSVRSTRADSG